MYQKDYIIAYKKHQNVTMMLKEPSLFKLTKLF